MPIDVTHGTETESKILQTTGTAGGIPGGVFQPFVGEAGRRRFRRGMLERGAELEKEEFEYKLTTQQKAEEQRLLDAMAEIDKPGGVFSEEEKKEAKRRIQARLWGIKPLPHRKEKMKPFAEVFKEQTHKDEYGNIYYRNPKTGEIKRIGTVESDALSTQDKRELWKDALKNAFNKETNKTDMNLARQIYQQSIDAIMGRGRPQIGPIGAGAGVMPGQTIGDLMLPEKDMMLVDPRMVMQDDRNVDPGFVRRDPRSPEEIDPGFVRDFPPAARGVQGPQRKPKIGSLFRRIPYNYPPSKGGKLDIRSPGFMGPDAKSPAWEMRVHDEEGRVISELYPEGKGPLLTGGEPFKEPAEKPVISDIRGSIESALVKSPLAAAKHAKAHKFISGTLRKFEGATSLPEKKKYYNMLKSIMTSIQGGDAQAILDMMPKPKKGKKKKKRPARTHPLYFGS